MPLSDKAIQAAKPLPASYKLADGEGMYLEVMPTGSKYWRLKYRFAGKEKRLALGVYPETSLAHAREKRLAARKLLAAGTDPSATKQEAKRNLGEGMKLLKLDVPKPPSIFEPSEEALF
jgi:hypothetical protein